MKGTISKATIALLIGMLAIALFSSAAQGAFGLHDVDGVIVNADGTVASQAGSHPFAVETAFNVNETGGVLDGQLRDAIVETFSGFVGDATAVPTCGTAEFVAEPNTCPDQTVVGANAVLTSNPAFELPYLVSSIYNLRPPPGAVARFGWKVVHVPVIVDVRVSDEPPYNVVATSAYTSNTTSVFSDIVQLWGVPNSSVHDFARGESCLGAAFGAPGAGVINGRIVLKSVPGVSCPSSEKSSPRPFITLPRACQGPLATAWKARSWQEPERWVEGAIITHDTATPPNPVGFTGCGKLGFGPGVDSKATTDSAETSTGLDFSIDIDDEGLTSENGLAQSDVKKTVVTLPEGVTVNPSIAEGLAVCAPADLARETLASDPGQGCPNGSKIGTVTVQTPLLDEAVNGSVFIGQQDDPATTQHGAENPFDSMLAFYIVLKNKFKGILIKQPAKVEPDPKTGQLITTVDDIPQLPFAHFEFHFREGQRAPLISPPSCGDYQTKAVFTPWARPDEQFTTTSSFKVTSGIGGGPCPSSGVLPFRPGFEAGSINSSAKAFSPFDLRLTRNDGEQDMTKFSATLPPGVLGKLAGVGKCPDSAITLAKVKTGLQELASPSCPANSKIGHTLAGAGVGEALTYVPGQLYLGGPYRGDPLSVIAITPAVAGPFDAGTVVVREALTVNPITAEVEVDGAASDPIPHILKGIPLKVRSLRVYTDRPEFIVNPTNCNLSHVKATLFGGFLDVFSPADDVPVDLSSNYQAANCLNLGMKPGLTFRLKGGTKRGDHPALRAVYTSRKDDANLKGLVVRLPRSAFLDQGHIRTVCTRVQFAADRCPPGAQYGYIKAWTPLLDEPLQGPVWLRSSDHKLPDLVFDLHGLVDIEVATRIDSANGGIRANIEAAPDAPVSKVELRMQGGKKGLIVNSRNLCAGRSLARARFVGQNGRAHEAKPRVRPQCGARSKNHSK